MKVDLFPDPREVLRLTTLALADWSPFETVDGAYLFGHTPDNEASIVEMGASLYNFGKARKVLLCGGGPYTPPNCPPDTKCAYSGAYEWRRQLLQKDVDNKDIIDIPRPLLSHTGTEAALFAKFAKEQGWQTAYIVAWPAHMLRAFANMVAAVNRFYPDLLVWCKPGGPLPWGRDALSSQGTVEGNRFTTVMNGEWDRLNVLYNNEFDLAGQDEIHEYVVRREQRASEMFLTMSTS